jgi:hypothetical protein
MGNTNPTKATNQSPVLVFLAGSVHSLFVFTGIFLTFQLALPWAFALAVVAAGLAIAMAFYKRTFAADEQASKLYQRGTLGGVVLSLVIFGVFWPEYQRYLLNTYGGLPSWMAIPQSINTPGFWISTLPALLFVGLRVAPEVYFWRRKQQEQ